MIVDIDQNDNNQKSIKRLLKYIKLDGHDGTMPNILHQEHIWS